MLGIAAGTLSPPVDLQVLGTPGCTLAVDPAGPLATSIAPIGAQTTLFTAPPAPVLSGFTGLVVQSLCWRPSGSPSFLPTDARAVVIGHL